MSVYRRSCAIAVLTVPLLGCAGQTHHSVLLEAAGDKPGDGAIHYALPRAMIELTLKRDAKGVVTLVAPVVQLVADTSARYAVRLNESILAHDKFVIETNPSGLLSSAKSDNTDKTPDIVIKALEGIKAVAETGLFRFGRSGRVAAGKSGAAPREEKLVIDPFRMGGKSTSPSRIASRISVIDLVTRKPLPYDPAAIAAAAAACHGSLCSRLVRPILLRLEGPNFDVQYPLDVPDPHWVAAHDVKRAPCVQRITTLSFSSGILSKFDLDKPSEVLGCIAIPVEIAKTVAAIPGSLLKARIEDGRSHGELNTVRAELIESRLKLYEMQTRLAELGNAHED